MAMACRENGTSEEVNQLKEVIRQLRGAVSMLNKKPAGHHGSPCKEVEAEG